MKYKDVISKRAFARSTLLPALYEKGFKKLALNISECADYLDYALCINCNTLHFNGFSSCKQRLCPICSKKRSLLLFKRFVPVFKQILAEGYYVNALNFTIVNTDNCKQTLETVIKAFRILTHDDKNMAREFKKRFVGGVRAIEIKLGANEKLYHTHFHCLVVKKTYSKDFDFLSQAWNKAVKLAGGKESETTPGLYGMVSIFGLRDKKNLDTPTEKSVEIGVLETLKYITKFDYDLNIDKLPELIHAVKGVRMLNTWGILRKINLNVEDEMNTPYRQLCQPTCDTCGGTDFFEFTSRHTFSNVHDFNLDNAILTKVEKDKPHRVIIWPDAPFEVGKKYGNILWTERHEALRGYEITVIYENKKYVYNQPTKVTKTLYSTEYIDNYGKVEASITEKGVDFKPICFSKEMITILEN